MKKNDIILAVCIVASVVALPLLVKAARGTEKSISDDSFLALKKRHECVLAAYSARMTELEAGWKVHQDARAEAQRTYDEAVGAANDIYRPCLAVKDEDACEATRSASRKQAAQELSTARTEARAAWKEVRKKAAADYKAARTACSKE